MNNSILFRVAKTLVRTAWIFVAIAVLALIVLLASLFGVFGFALSFGWGGVLFGVMICSLLAAVVCMHDARNHFQKIATSNKAS